MKRHVFLSWATAGVAVLVGNFGWPVPAAAQQATQVLKPPGNPETDPPLPAGTADDIIARMAARRAQQAAQSSPTIPSMPVSSGTGSGFATPPGATFGRGGFNPGPATEPPAPLPPSQVAPNTDMRFNYDNATVDAVLRDIARAYGFIIISNVALSQRVTVRVEAPVNAEDALQILNAVLLTQGYGTLKTMSDNTPQAKTILRIATLSRRE